VDCSIDYLDAVQERNRGAELHEMICRYLGYSITLAVKNRQNI